MALALGSWTRAAVVLVTPLILFAAVAVAANLIIEASPPPGYYEEPAYVPVPTGVTGPNCQNESVSQVFHGVTFNLTVIDECAPAGPWLMGTVTEANGTTFHFGIWSMAFENQTWFSPDHQYCGVRWVGGINEDVVMLYVKS